MIEYLDKIFPNQPPEVEIGNKEYKRNLLNQYPKNKFLHKRATQMKYRLLEGDGKAIYILGIEDCGRADGINEIDLDITIDNIKKIVEIIEAKIIKIRVYNSNSNNKIATVRILLEDYADNFGIDNF
jgi:GTPase